MARLGRLALGLGLGLASAEVNRSGHGHLRRLGTVAAEVGANADASLRCGPLDMPENAQCKEVQFGLDSYIILCL